MVNISNDANAGGSGLSEAHYSWAQSFCGIDLRPDTMTSTAPSQTAGLPGGGGQPPAQQAGGTPKAPATQQPTLRRGDKGTDGWVEYLQELLNDLTNAGLTVDGDFGGGTERAVTTYQSKAKLMVDGVVGNQTWASLRGTTPEAPSTDGRAPHTFHESGKEARWYLSDGGCVYNAPKDELSLQVVSTGDEPADGGKATVTASSPAGVKHDFMLTLGKSIRKTQSGQGNIHEIIIAKFHETADPSTPIEAFVLEGVLDNELGGDRFTSHITVTIGKIDVIPNPPHKPGPSPQPGPHPQPGPTPKAPAGTRPVDVQVIATDWKGEPMQGFEGIVEFKSPSAPEATGGGEIKGGVVTVRGLNLSEKGTFRFICISRGGAQVVPEGVIAFTRPEKGSMIFTASQQFRNGKVSATSGQEAAQKVGASGKLGADFKVFSAEGEITTESELKQSHAVTIEFEVRLARAAFDLKQN